MSARALLAAAAAVALEVHAIPPDEAAIGRLLRERIDVSQRGVGIVVGIVDADGRRIVAHGITQRGGATRVDGDTVFEVGAVTMVFTSLLLAEMAGRGEVALDDRAGGRAVTLRQLSRHAVDRDGGGHRYSNDGPALLGEILARRAGRDYDALLRERVLGPLGMGNTAIVRPAIAQRRALGHSARGKPVPAGDFGAERAAIGLQSTVNDMNRFLAANLELSQTALSSAIRTTHRVEADPRLPGLKMGLGWFHAEFGKDRVLWHAGRTAGFAAFAGLDPARRRGVVILSNSANDVANLGLHLLTPAVPLVPLQPPRRFRAVAVEPELLDEYAGTYRPAPGHPDFLAFIRKGGELVATHRQGTYKVYAESDTTFFSEDMEDWGTFTRNVSGVVDGITWYRGDSASHFKRMP